MNNKDTFEQMKLIETVLQCHEYNYSRIYQRVTRGLIRVQYDFRSNIEDLNPAQRGCLLVTKMLLKNYGINALIEITDEKGTPHVLFRDDFAKISAKEELVI